MPLPHQLEFKRVKAGLQSILQATIYDGLALDVLTFSQDRFALPK
jgi:hypothetical protein